MEWLYRLDYKNIAQKVKKARKSAHLTQAKLAEKINISTNAVAKLESNLMMPSLQTLVNIANTLNIDINDLLKDEGTTSQEEAYTDMILNGLIHNLSHKDKEFMIYVANGIKLYYGSDVEK